MIDTGVPLGVRIFDLRDGVDVYVTRFTDDFSFRSTAPGGFASATLKVHFPTDRVINPEILARPYYRVQIVDYRSAEIVWEGRIEDPATKIGENAWEVGVMGSSVVATDVSRPMLYLDSGIENWVVVEADAWDVQINADSKVIEVHMKPGYVYGAGNEFSAVFYDGTYRCRNVVGRIAMQYAGTGPGAQAANFDLLLETIGLGNIDITAFNAAQIYKANIVPTDLPVAATGYHYLFELQIRRRSGTGNYTIGASEEGIARFKYPKVQGLRVNQLGLPLIAASDYNHGDWLSVAMVVRDVVGRYLGGARLAGIDLGAYDNAGGEDLWFNVPVVGAVRGDDAYIDDSEVDRILNLWFSEPTDAKGILDALTNVQPEAYWAIWESGHRHSQEYIGKYSDGNDQLYRFEWATWPDAPNYFATSEDGLEMQLSIDGQYNSASNTWINNESSLQTDNVLSFAESDSILVNPQLGYWRTEELEYRFPRHFHLVTSDPAIPGTTDDDQEKALRAQMNATQEPRNSGKVTIRRPIFYMHKGDTSGNGGYSGMVQPWEIKPGRLIRIRDILPRHSVGDIGLVDVGGKTNAMNANPDFETGTTTGWGPVGGTLAIESTIKRLGSFSGKLTPSGVATDSFIATGFAPFTPGAKYRFTAWIRNAVARQVFLQIHWYDNTTTFISAATSRAYNLAANTWTFASFTAIAPGNAVQGPALVTMGGTPAASHILYVDEATLVRYPVGHENCVFRVAATEYNTADNSCTLELDELPKWSMPTQIVNPLAR